MEAKVFDLGSLDVKFRGYTFKTETGSVYDPEGNLVTPNYDDYLEAGWWIEDIFVVASAVLIDVVGLKTKTLVGTPIEHAFKLLKVEDWGQVIAVDRQGFRIDPSIQQDAVGFLYNNYQIKTFITLSEFLAAL